MESGVAGDKATNTNHQYEAWCSQHQMHPSDCFEIHYPEAIKEESDSDPESTA